MILPSKELLTKMFHRKIGKVHINGTDVEIYPIKGIARSIIQIDDLLHKMKKLLWDMEENFSITYITNSLHIKYVDLEFNNANALSYHHFKRERVLSHKPNTEFEAVTNACEWLLIQKEENDT